MRGEPRRFPGTTASGALLIANRPFALGGNPLFGFGSSEGPRDYDGFRVSASLNGDISDSLSWDVAVTYMEQNATREGRDTVVNRYQRHCADSAARTATSPRRPERNGCFWYNPFNNAIRAIRSPVRPTRSSPALAQPQPELINWMFPIVSTDSRPRRMVFDAVLSGTDRHRLPGGALGWAFGAQYREDRSKRRTAT